jgi:4'-phosphopantetheinyl transferase
VPRKIEIVVARARPGSVDPARLPAQVQARAARFAFEADRRRYVGSHELLRAMLAERAARPGLRYSLSRSGELAAYAFSCGCAVGIDVEEMRPLAECDCIAAACFPARERRAYEALRDGAARRAFYRGWTRTEALAKALGGGLTLAREALDEALGAGWIVHSFTPAPGFAGAIAVAPAART